MNVVAEIFKGMVTPDGQPSKKTLEQWKDLTDGLVEGITMQQEEIDKLKVENEELRACLREANRQNDILRAQLNMVSVIFGGNR